MHISASVDDILPENSLIHLVSLVLSHGSDLAVIEKVLIEPLLSNGFFLQLVLSIDLGLLGGNSNLRMILHVRVDHKGSKGIIHLFVDLILDDREDVETR